MKAPPDLDDDQLTKVVHAFYARVRQDDRIGPLFNAAVEDWDEHLDRLSRFWSSVMLTSGRYKGNPMAAHRRHAEAIEPSMFDRWLELWADVTDELMPPAAAAAMQAKAAHIADSLKLGLFFRVPPHEPQASARASS
ncbi:group III truncated hemoglobin [Allosphingosinicella sp.]|uniref:group III truncated hemoglobin n=1 Tax=Allosphingosinicella sp. TaxID=2823234 RepID=UPI002FC27250